MAAETHADAAKIAARTAKVNRMSGAAKARDLFIDIAGPGVGSAWVTRAINKVAVATGIPHRRLRGIWGGEARRIDSEEMDALRAAAKNEKAAADELSELRTRIARLERLLDAHPSNIRREGRAADR